MKIGIEAQRIFRPQKAGMDWVVLNLLKEFQKMNTGITFVVFAMDGEDRDCLPPHSSFQIEIVKAHNYLDWEQRHLPAAIKKHRLDMMHFTSNTASLSKINVPIVLTVHDIIYLERSFKELFKGSNYQIMGNFYRRFVVPRAMSRASKIITVSNFEKDNISSAFPQYANKIYAVHNGISKEFESPQFFKKEVNLPEKYFLHIGNTEPRKNTKRVLQAFASYKEKVESKTKLLVSGLKQDILNTWLSELNLSRLSSQVLPTGYIPTRLLPTYYNSSTALVFPSLREGFGLPPLEAMACNTSVITSRSSSIPEVCSDHALYVNPLDTNDIAAALQTIENDFTKRFELESKGQIHARNFLWRKSADKILSIYKSTQHEL